MISRCDPRSTASTTRPSMDLDSGSETSDQFSRCGSTRPWPTASYIAPCPRRCSATNVRSTSERTGPSAQSTASVDSNNASVRAVNDR
jgi:hypothetical protein